MIVRARTSKGLSWTGRAGVLGLSVLILPLAPTWAQKPGNLSSDTPSALLAAIATDGPASADAAPASRPADLQAQEPSDPTADRPDGASRQQEAADRLQKRLKELGDKLVKDLGPLGEEVRKALENAASEVSDTLKKEDLSGDDVRNALDRARDQVRKAFETGGPVEKEAREAFEKARRDMRESVESAHRELRETMLSRREEAEKQSLRERAVQGRARRSPITGRRPGKGSFGSAQDGARAAQGDATARRPGAPRRAWHTPRAASESRCHTSTSCRHRRVPRRRLVLGSRLARPRRLFRPRLRTCVPSLFPALTQRLPQAPPARSTAGLVPPAACAAPVASVATSFPAREAQAAPWRILALNAGFASWSQSSTGCSRSSRASRARRKTRRTRRTTKRMTIRRLSRPAPLVWREIPSSPCLEIDRRELSYSRSMAMPRRGPGPAFISRRAFSRETAPGWQ